MTGEEVPKDEQDENKVPNLRLKFLEELQGVAKSAFTSRDIVGLTPGMGGTIAYDFQTPMGWVNHPDVWECKLADSENSIVRDRVKDVVVASEKLLSGIDSEISNIHANNRAKVREDDPDARWTPS